VLGEKSIARVDLQSPEGELFSTALQCTYSESSADDDGGRPTCQRSGRRHNLWRTRSSKKSRARRARLKVLATWGRHNHLPRGITELPRHWRRGTYAQRECSA